MFDVFVAEKDAFNTADEKKALEHIYPLCTTISIDFGIMEKANNVYVIPASFGWSDLGTWNSVYENLEKDYLGNAIAGKKVLVIDAAKCVVHSGNKKLLFRNSFGTYRVILEA